VCSWVLSNVTLSTNFVDKMRAGYTPFELVDDMASSPQIGAFCISVVKSPSVLSFTGFASQFVAIANPKSRIGLVSGGPRQANFRDQPSSQQPGLACPIDVSFRSLPFWHQAGDGYASSGNHNFLPGIEPFEQLGITIA
jgi:hypothetical protein